MHADSDSNADNDGFGLTTAQFKNPYRLGGSVDPCRQQVRQLTSHWGEKRNPKLSFSVISNRLHVIRRLETHVARSCRIEWTTSALQKELCPEISRPMVALCLHALKAIGAVKGEDGVNNFARLGAMLGRERYPGWPRFQPRASGRKELASGTKIGVAR